MSTVDRIKKLVSTLNQHRNLYYNNQSPTISDYEYDKLFDELKCLEEETGIVLSNSPTQTVGFEVKSELQKIKHSHPMLSLDKTKSVDDLKKFASKEDCMISLKLDGLTILLTYDNGELIRAETRGNGEEGEIVTHNARVFENIPLHINYSGRLEVEGEAIITYDDFEKINNAIENPDERYKNPRNLVSGSVRQLNSNIAAQRHIKFIAWKVPTKMFVTHGEETIMSGKLSRIRELGFDIVPYVVLSSTEYIDYIINNLKNIAEKESYPIDGLVMTYDNISYGESLGCTGHHPKHSLAFKFYDEEVETTLKSIDWTIGKTGVLTPTAIFEPVEIDGTTVERASLHNISILNETLGGTPHVGQKITVYKANQIIPQVLNADKKPNYNNVLFIPLRCPICGGNTEVKQENNSQVLICANDNCKGKLLGKLVHFVSKNAMNIDGMSEATLKKFINKGWINSFKDVMNIKDYYYLIAVLDGFGAKSARKLIDAIEASKNTTLDRFIYSLCIPLIGRSASKTISQYFDDSFERFYNEGCLNYFDFENLEGFGFEMSYSVRQYLNANIQMIKELADIMTFKTPKKEVVPQNINLVSKTFVITGSLNTFANRDEAKEQIEALGGKVSGSVSAKTSYLVNNDINSTSGKNKKAKELGIPIITEEDLINMMKYF